MAETDKPKKKTTSKAVAEVQQDPKDSDTLSFQIKRHHFYAALLPVAFALGIGVGYLAWGGQASFVPVAQQEAAQQDTTPVQYDISIDEDDPVYGPEDAEITIIEFSDFQCPYCESYATQTYPQLAAAYEGRIRFVHKDFPLTSIHPQAFPAALAARCAKEQGEFWEYHDLLFSQQRELSDESYIAYAGDLGLDVDEFTTCYEEERYAEEVQASLDNAIQLGVSSTPTFFVNGYAVIGAQPFSTFEQAIQYALDNQG